MDRISSTFVLPASKRLAAAKPARPKRKKPSPAGRPNAAELERRKSRVMEVATALFVERGYAGTSLVDIAELAGVATRTVYQHFGDKEAIFREVIYARNIASSIERPHVQEGDTLFATLRRVADYTYAMTIHKQASGLMRLMIAESNRFPDFMRSLILTIHSRFLRSIQTVFDELEEAGLAPRGDHARSAELFEGTSQGSHPIMFYANWAAELPSSADLDERVELFILGRFGPAIARTAKTKKAKARNGQSSTSP